MIKKIFIFFYYLIWLIKSRYNFWLWGPYGVSHCIKECPHPFIVKLLRKYGATIGDNCNFERGLILHRPDKEIPFKNLTIGENVYLGHNIIIDLTRKVKIDSFTALSSDCQIWTHSSNWSWDRNDEKENETKKEVQIGKSVILYCGVIISPGVMINDYARVGAGSVVIKDIGEMEFHAGVPAKLIYKRDFNNKY